MPKIDRLPQPVRTLLDEHTRYLTAGSAAERTIGCRLVVLTACLAAVGDPLVVDRAALVGWLATPGWSPWTRATYRGHLRGFFGWLCEFGHRDDDPAAKLRRPRVPAGVPRPVTDAELVLVLARVPAWFRPLVILCAFAGLRVSEAARLCREDITAETLTVRAGKGGKSAVVPTHPRIWALVADLPPGPVLRGRYGQALTGKYLSSAAREVFDRLGLDAVHCHRFRHWFGTSVQANQGDIRVTQELMRHASIASTAIYTQVATAAKVAAIAGLAA